jgi:NADH dehydrogenase (ubiquinone) 1 alpha/beta subcomplex 1
MKVGSRPLPLVFGAEAYLNLDVMYRSYPEKVRLKALLMVTKLIRNIPEVDKIQIYHANIFYRSMLDDNSKSELTKEDITTRVVNVIHSYPKVCDYKVTAETHFKMDLGFNMWDCIEVLQALQVEFKLYIPDDIVSCKLAIEYIYDHRMERLSLSKFRRCFVLTSEFGESKAEFRRIFVPGEKKGEKKAANYIKCGLLDRDSHCETFSWNGFKPFQFYRRMQPRFYAGLF